MHNWRFRSPKAVILDILESLEKVLHFFYYLQDMIPYAHRSNKPNIQIYLEHKQNLTVNF
jgi:hypothetical protein